MELAPRCLACGAMFARSFYQVASIPVHSCVLVETREAALAFPRGDLELGFCEACGFIQNRRFDPSLLDYSADYEETQGFSPRFRRFLGELCEQQIRKHALGGKTVVEIGCGKGEFLAQLCEVGGCRGIGIDPAYRPERMRSAAADRLTFIRKMFGPDYGALTVDYICCRHTLEHIPDVGEFLRLVRQSIGDHGPVALFFELPDTERVLIERGFWDIYYEHCSYFTLGSLARLFGRCGFTVTDLGRGFDDQYLLLEACPAPGLTAPDAAQSDDLERTRRQVAAFEAGVAAKLADLRAAAQGWREQGRTAVVWGSGSKAVGYLNTLQLGDEVAAVVDINPHKHGKFQAGTGHQIIGPDLLVELQPDVVVVMNPIYLDEIRDDLQRRGLAPEITALA
jgi:SAM-dependent methyltransferase